MARPANFSGLDVGGTFLEAARVDPDGRIPEQARQPIAGESALIAHEGAG